MAYNLSRNSRVFVTTNLSTASGQSVASGGNSTVAGQILSSGFTTANTFEIQVLDGFTFSQGTNNTQISINEAGSTPVRGQRSFNTALNPVEVSFSTYIRPRVASNQATAEERVLWNALLGSVGIEGTTQAGAVVAAATLGGTPTATLTRATTGSPTVTFAGTALNSAGITLGGIYTVSGLTGTGAFEFNAPVVVTASSGTAIVVDYLTAPAVGLVNVANVAVTAGVKFNKSAWVEHPTASGITTSYAQVTTAQSNKNQLQSIGFLFLVDSQWYGIDNAVMDGVSLDFGLDAIATLAWTAKGTRLNTINDPTGTDLTQTNPILGTSGSLSGTALGKVVTANYITNKLSTVTLKSNLNGVSGTSYVVPLTGGSFSIANNINYITPNNIGTVNIPIGYFTGARAINGTMNAYLRTGTSGDAGSLLSAMLANIGTAAETKYYLQIEVGGSSNGTRVELEIAGCSLGIPSVDIQDVVSTAITFNAQSTSKDVNTVATAEYDLENTNDLEVRYYSV